MRTIIKGAPDRFLTKRYNRSQPMNAGDASRSWGKFSSRYKARTKKVCEFEQYGLCGYSEIQITPKSIPIYDSQCSDISKNFGSHLEHIEPKSKNPSRTFDHYNLILSAISDVKASGLAKSDVFGGHHKARIYSNKWFISPLVPNAREYFHYETSTGKIVPKSTLPSLKEKAKARLTIYALNLNAPILIYWRKTWLQELENILASLTTREEIYNFAELELSPVGNRYLRPFHSAQRQVFGRIGDQICKSLNL
ncbi:TIGR02646 family protein [Vibrio fluvialis]|nr:TIGR02646 family protein [Vibrio fluvialis]